MVGFFEFKGLTVSPGYKEFYKTAIRALEKDPNRDTAFAVVTDPQTASQNFYIDYTPAIVLYLWNESLVSYNNNYFLILINTSCENCNATDKYKLLNFNLDSKMLIVCAEDFLIFFFLFK